jgi:hypothetical protein
MTGGYLLQRRVRTDWSTLAQLAAEASAADADDPIEGRRLRSEALSLVRGIPFTDATDGLFEWTMAEHHVHAMTVAITACAHDLSTDCLSAGDIPAAASASRKGLLAVPDSVVLHCDLIDAVRLGGDPAELRMAWDEARQSLGTDGVARIAEELRSGAHHRSS